MDPERLELALEQRVEELGFELVELERGGTRSRPVLRLRIDRPDSQPGHGVSVDDCARVSRALEAFLETEAEVPERYVLEISSPGVERPLVRRRDWDRFVGYEIAVKGHGVLANRGRRLEGRLLGVVEADGERVRLQLADGSIEEIPRAEIAAAHLVFRWKRD
jgi:ribosome maturation factor RimP